MNNRLENARKEIDTIDYELACLFEKRLEVVQKIIEYKIEHQLPILDSSREKSLLQKNSAYLQDSTILPYYQQWLQETMRISKQFQQDFLESQSSEVSRSTVKSTE